VTRFVDDCETLLRVAAGETPVAAEHQLVALTQLQADVFVTSDGDLARAVAGLVETATIDALGTT
jgi:hypothetical protein